MKVIKDSTFQDPDFANRSVTNVPNKIAVCVKPLHFSYDQVRSCWGLFTKRFFQYFYVTPLFPSVRPSLFF